MRRIICRVVLFCLAGCGTAGVAQVYQGIEEKLPVEAAPQPVPFSHKRHVAAGLSCNDCHENAGKKERAGLPDGEKCMLCHRAIKTESPAIQKLAQMDNAGVKLAWVRIYRTPDFVFFSHASHVNGGVACASCHGPVAEREVLAKEVSTSMITCMNCHAAKKVSTECHLCHELGQ